MAGLGARMDAVIEPRAVGVALEAVQPASVGDLDRAEPLDRHRQQPTGVDGIGGCRSGVPTVPILDDDDHGYEQAQQRPDEEDSAAPTSHAQRCFHHTALPTTASTAGTSTTDRNKVAFIWRLVGF